MPIKEALIPAGGLGTRLRAVTQDKIPKPLVEVKEGTTMLDMTIQGLRSLGIDTIVISVSHLGEDIQQYLSEKYQGWHLDVIYEEEKLGTGGSIRNFIVKGQNRPFIMTPADNFVTWAEVTPFHVHAGQVIDDSLTVWAATTKYRYSQVPHNIWADAETNRVVATTSGHKTAEERAAIHAEYAAKSGFINATSAGILAINQAAMLEHTQQYLAPFCIYKDLLPRWVDEGAHVLMSLTNAQVIDMGTPERLELVRQIVGE